MTKKLLIVGFLLLVIAQFIPARSLSNNNTPEQKLPEFQPKDIEVYGWTAWWDEENTFKSLVIAIDYIDGFSPTLYHIEPDGSLGELVVDNREELLGLAREYNFDITPVIGDDFDSERVDLLLYDKQIQDDFIKRLVEEAEKENFKGWDVNIESVDENDREVFSSFIKNLADTLHQNGLTLTVTLFARGEEETFTGALAHDYEEVGKSADRVQLMLYGYHNDETDPGAQAPLSWYREVLGYVVRKIPREKVVIGLSTHGFDWGGKQVEALTYPEVTGRIKKHSASFNYNWDEGSVVSIYEKDDQKHTMWFEDAQTIRDKMAIALREFNINKFIIWRIGAEDPNLWHHLLVGGFHFPCDFPRNPSGIAANKDNAFTKEKKKKPSPYIANLGFLITTATRRVIR